MNDIVKDIKSISREVIKSFNGANEPVIYFNLSTIDYFLKKYKSNSLADIVKKYPEEFKIFSIHVYGVYSVFYRNLYISEIR